MKSKDRILKNGHPHFSSRAFVRAGSLHKSSKPTSSVRASQKTLDDAMTLCKLGASSAAAAIYYNKAYQKFHNSTESYPGKMDASRYAYLHLILLRSMMVRSNIPQEKQSGSFGRRINHSVHSVPSTCERREYRSA